MSSFPRKKAWPALVHQIYQQGRQLGFASGSVNSMAPQLVVLCSGGVDSMVLLSVLRQLAPAWGWQLQVLHFHHGGLDHPFRQKAQKRVTQVCQEWGLPLSVVVSPIALTGEKQMRDFRRQHLKRIWSFYQLHGSYPSSDQLEIGVTPEIPQTPTAPVTSNVPVASTQARLTSTQKRLSRPLILATAHHAQDLLETRCLRLLRGVGPQGLQAMTSYRSPWWRPFLEISRSQLVAYAQAQNLTWVEDPSNADTRYLRNWLRHQWLPTLEKREPGSRHRLALSLHTLVQTFQQTPRPPWRRQGQVVPSQAEETSKRGDPYQMSWAYFLAQPSAEQLRFVAWVYWRLRVQDYSTGQIREVQRRLTRSSGDVDFVVGQVQWSVQKTWLNARKAEFS